MTVKRNIQAIVVLMILALCFTSVGSARAGAPGCASSITVQWGDTLSSIAAMCGTTVEAIRAANPGIGWWIYAGQVLYMPTGYSPTGYYPGQASGQTYVVQWGDTLGGIAMMYGVSLSDLLAVNPQIWNASLIYPGQVINLPVFVSVPGNYFPPSFNPPPSYNPPIYNPAPTTSSGFSNLRVTYGHGLLVRTGPGINFSEIKSRYVSAVKNSHWVYRKNSLTTDSIGFVWVEIQLNPLSGFSTGWILVRDSLGNYFTSPNLGPKITPNDP